MIRCSFELTHFSQGRSRKAYRGVLTAHPQPGLIGKRVTSYQVQFSSQPFAEGTFQYAYRGTLLSPGNMDVVVKKFKDESANYRQEWQNSVNTSKKAEELARKFNETAGTNPPIHFNIPTPMKLNNSYYSQNL